VGDLSASIVALIEASGSSFLGDCGYTMARPDKIALITGTSSGFGLLTSIELAQAGFRVVATVAGSWTP
jgi:hypothetical protein